MNEYSSSIEESIVNREEYLSKTFPLEDGTTYIQSIDRYHSHIVDNTEVSSSSDTMYNWIRRHSGK